VQRAASRPNLRADVRLAFPPTLTPRQRALLHEVAERVGLQHASTGEEGARCLVIGGDGGASGGVNGDGGDDDDDNENTATNNTTVVVAPADTPTDDDDQDNIAALAALLKAHLNLEDAADLLSAAKARHAENQQRREAARAAARAAAALPGATANITAADAHVTLEAFVERTAKLLDMERDAEVVQAAEAAAAATPAAAAARGSALLGLRLADAEGGLLGRTLLTLVANKGFAQGAPVSEAPPLPPHKFGPHDLVAIKPNKQGGGGGGGGSGADAAAAAAGGAGGAGGGAGGGALATGLVYRIRDNAIVVAVDDAPDEGLDVPLRLEKLANETTHKRMCETLACLRAAAAAGGGQAAAQAAAAAAAGGGGGGRHHGNNPHAAELPGAALADVCFGQREPRFLSATAAPRWKPVTAPLDGSQRRAVGLALRAQDVALIHGPPGTGKTTAVVELIVQEVLRGSRVLAAAASNVAVDNLVERVVKAAAGGGAGFFDDGDEEEGEGEEEEGGGNGNGSSSSSSRPPTSTLPDPSASLKGLRVVRMGHPARLLPQVLDASLEAHVRRSDDSALARDCAKERRRLAQQLVKLEPWKRAERRAARAELRDLGKEERKRQERAVREVVRSARVVCATLTGCLHPHLRAQTFDVVVVDEAAQALEPACWGALLKGRRAVLAGDHLQLPPTVLSQEACDKGLGVTLFERLQVLYGGVVSAGGGGGEGGGGAGSSGKAGGAASSASEMLTVQYRMHRDIMDWSSKELYGGKLTAHPSVAEHTLADLAAGGAGGRGGAGGGGRAGAAAAAATASAAAAPTTANPPYPLSEAPVLLLIDTAGCGFEESRDEDGANAESLRNEGEARAALAHAERLIASGLAPSSIGLITPYSAQVALLRSMRPERLAQTLEVSTVDGFQGREKEAIIFSAVRSSSAEGGGGGGAGVGFLRDSRRANVSVTRARRHCALVADTETLRRDPFLSRLIDHFEARGEYISAQELVPG
jgi:ATP-dependent RNA/DNA helicase IGHMBP2